MCFLFHFISFRTSVSGSGRRHRSGSELTDGESKGSLGGGGMGGASASSSSSYLPLQFSFLGQIYRKASDTR